MTLRAPIHLLLIACLGVVLAQAGAACAMSAGHAAHAAMSDGPCPHEPGGAAPPTCPMICPMSCIVAPAAIEARRIPYVVPVRFDETLRPVSSIRLAPEDPPPR